MSDVGLRRFRWLLPVALVLGVVLATPLGRWMTSAALPGSATQNAYVAFGQWNWTRPDEKALDPIARANLELADEHLAAQLAERPRIHPPGTLATLEYTTVGANGEELDRWHIRAIVPEPGDVNEPDAAVWTTQVPDVESRLKQQGGMVLRSSGSTGIPPEAVLRFRVGEAIETPAPDEFVATDFLDRTTYRFRKRAFSLPTGSMTAPARLRVRLVEACPADVRVGRTTKMEFARFAPVPIPVGFRELRWVQMTGCTPRANLGESPTNALPVTIRVPAVATDSLLRIGRDGVVHADASSQQAGSSPLHYKLETICRFDAEEDRWQVLLQSSQSTEPVELATLARTGGPTEPRVVARLPPVALYWLRWSVGPGGADTAALRSHHSFGVVGGVLCEDVDLGPAPAGRVAACIPFPKRAEAKFVPDPVVACAARQAR